MPPRTVQPLTCPLSGCACVGVEACAPAVFSKGELRNATAPACPIVVAVGSLVVLSTALHAAAVSTVEDDAPQGVTEPPAQLPGGVIPDQEM